ncbi:MAG: CHASE2 domain-containing protein [Solirubrobacteraceae bacterium]|jgi:CHASE2 domain-containing sensor protein
MSEEPSAAQLSPEATYRSIGRYVYEFSQLVGHMREAMTKHLDRSGGEVAAIAFAEAGPRQIANAFFTMCRTVARLDPEEERTGARIGSRVGEAIDLRENVAAGEWWVGASSLGAEAVRRSARELDGRSDLLAALTNIVTEYGALCLRLPPYSRGEHRVSDYIVLRAGEAVREGPKALATPRVFYKPASPSEVGEAAEPLAALHQPVVEAEAVVEVEPEPVRAPPPEPPPAPEPEAPAPSRPDSQTPQPAPGHRSFRVRIRVLPGAVRGWLAASQRTERVTVPGAGGVGPAWLTQERLRRCMLAIAALTALLLSIAAYGGRVFNSLEQNTIDSRFAIRGTQKPPSDIVIVGIDNQTTSSPTFPRWPAPRVYDASVINNIRRGDPKAIGVDIQFTSPTDPTDDDDLIEAVEHTPGIVLSTTAVLKGGNTSIFNYSTQDLRSQLGAYAANTNVPAFDASLPYEESGLKTFGVILTEQATHHPVPRADFPHNTALVDFAGPPNTTFQERSFADVCSSVLKGCTGAVKPGFFHDKIVLIGATAPVLQDVHPTPEGGDMPGVELWANEVWSILRGNPLRYAPGAINILAIVLMTLAMPLVVLRMRPGLNMIGIAIAIGAVYLVVAQLEFNANTVLPIVYPMLGLLLGTVEAGSADLWAERIARRHLEVYKTAYEALPSTEGAAFFVSYRRDQSSWPARILHDELERRFGEDAVFKDSDSIQAGQAWPERLEAAIADASVVLVVIGPEWADARDRNGARRLEDPQDWVRLEVEKALSSEQAQVVPVLVDGATMPAPSALPESLRPLTEHQAFALTVEKWSSDLDALIASIQSGRIRDFLTKQRAASTN